MFLNPILLVVPFVETWQQVSLGYIESSQSNIPFSVANWGSGPISIAGTAGVDGPRHQWIIGANPTPSPSWDSRFNPLYQGTVSQNWSVPGHTLPAGYGSFLESFWTHKSGWQTFELYVDGVASGTQARRDLDWWVPNGTAFAIVPLIAEDPGEPIDPGEGE